MNDELYVEAVELVWLIKATGPADHKDELLVKLYDSLYTSADLEAARSAGRMEAYAKVIAAIAEGAGNGTTNS